MPSLLCSVVPLCWMLACNQLQPADLAKIPPAFEGKIDFARDIEPIFRAACTECHGPKKQRGSLRLDHGEFASQGGNSGPVIVARQATKSLLLHLISGLDPEKRMPPDKANALSAQQVGKIRAWIDQGAEWPMSKATTIAAKSDHWAFQPIVATEPPAAKGVWAQTAIDRFILARLEKEGIAPAEEAGRVTLIRRLSFDLIGLPPTPQEIDDFVQDNRADAYERVVDRLLKSPHYGERWGRHWLDLARYADSDGYEQDRPRPFAWRYRDWVIAALNRDMSFDQFTIEQLAGDLLPNASLDQKTATGFHRNTLTNREGGTDKEQFRVEACVDRVSTTAKTWLGLTMGCAQCHDHKYDPFSQREFYQFFAFFNSDNEVDLPAPLSGEEQKTEPTEKIDPKKEPAKPYVPTLGAGQGRKTHVLIRGDFLRPGVEVKPATPSVLPPMKTGGTPTRLDLAKWIVDPANPLTPRVIVNWAWQRYFGRGLVSTLEDFGTQGEKPSHPELLDWLAKDFVGNGWSLKKLHKTIVMSATYRQSSKRRPELAARDPLNVLLGRQARLRLEAEILRDNALAVSGLLHRRIGGPSVRPPQPAGVSELTYANTARWIESKGNDRYRRGMYTWFQRTSPYPLMTTFDAPDGIVCTVRRERSNTPLAALMLLNDPVFVECAQGLAKRVLAEAPRGTGDRIDWLMRTCVGRLPTQAERTALLGLHREMTELAKANPQEAGKLAGPTASAESRVDAAAWVGVTRLLLNLDEFMVRE
jgi:hypothetical protein